MENTTEAPRLFTRAQLKTLQMALDALEAQDKQASIMRPTGELETIHAIIKAEMERPDGELAEGESLEGDFKNRQEAFQWLRERGLKMGKSAFYQGIADGNWDFPPLIAGKRLRRLDCYRFLLRQQAKGNVAYRGQELETLAWRGKMAEVRKQEAEADIAFYDAVRLKRENAQEWIRRNDAYNLYKDIEGQIINATLAVCWEYAPAFIREVGGDESLAPMLCNNLEFALQKAQKQTTRQAVAAFFPPEEGDEAPLWNPPPN